MNSDEPVKLKSYRAGSAQSGRGKNKNPAASGARDRKRARLRADYFAKTNLAARALAREAAFLCTTPDFTALSIAEA